MSKKPPKTTPPAAPCPVPPDPFASLVDGIIAGGVTGADVEHVTSVLATAGKSVDDMRGAVKQRLDVLHRAVQAPLHAAQQEAAAVNERVMQERRGMARAGVAALLSGDDPDDIAGRLVTTTSQHTTAKETADDAVHRAEGPVALLHDARRRAESVLGELRYSVRLDAPRADDLGLSALREALNLRSSKTSTLDMVWRDAADQIAAGRRLAREDVLDPAEGVAGSPTGGSPGPADDEHGLQERRRFYTPADRLRAMLGRSDATASALVQFATEELNRLAELNGQHVKTRLYGGDGDDAAAGSPVEVASLW